MFPTFAPISTTRPIAREHPMLSGMLSWWLPVASKAGGTRLYDLVGSNHATIVGSPPWVKGFGVADSAVHLPGTIAVTKYAVADCPTLSAYTLAVRVVFDSLYPPDSPNSNNSILKNWGSVTVAGYFHWNMVGQGDSAAPGNIRCYASTTGSGVVTAVTSNPLSVGVPYHLVVTCGNGVLKLYTNGINDGSTTYTGSLTSNATKIAFGCKLQDDQSTPVALSTDNSLLAGTLGDTAMWGRALSDAEVARLFAEARTGYPNLLRRPHAFVPVAAPPPPSGSGWLGLGYSEEDPMSITWSGWNTDLNAANVAAGASQAGSALSLDGKAAAILSLDFAKADDDGKAGYVTLEYLKDRDGTNFETRMGDPSRQSAIYPLPAYGSTTSIARTVYASEGSAIKPVVRVTGCDAIVTLRTKTGTA